MKMFNESFRNRFTDQYLETILWSCVPINEAGSSDRTASRMGLYISDVESESRAEARSFCDAFIDDNAAALLQAIDDIREDETHIAHLLVLTRNGDGSGLWEHDGEHWSRLANYARDAGSVNIEVIDGKVVLFDG